VKEKFLGSYHEKFGEVPAGWEVTSIGKCFDFFPTSSYSRSKLIENGSCGYIHYGDIHTKYHRFLDLEKDIVPYVTNDMAKRFTKIQDGDLIISDASEDYEGVGKAVEVVNTNGECIISGLHTLHLRPKENTFITGFSGYLLNHDKIRHNILRIATGIKVYSISKTELKKVLLLKPPKPEQTAIANILSKVDETIEATQNSIKAAEKLKKALMQNLLTGKLKPDGTWRKDDEFYEDEKFGKVPIGWELKYLKDVFAINLESLSSKTDPNYSFRYITIEAVSTEIIDFKSCPIYLFKDSPGRARRILKDGDILISGVRPNLKAFAIYNNPDKGKWICSTGFYVLTAKEKENNEFYFYQVLSEIGEKQFHSWVAGSNYPAIGERDIKRMKLYCPCFHEQNKIANKLKAISESNHEKQTKIQTLQRLKKSLMQHLLTGKVRLDENTIKKMSNGS
jgi:type I restriction enzyme S subunit